MATTAMGNFSLTPGSSSMRDNGGSEFSLTWGNNGQYSVTVGTNNDNGISGACFMTGWVWYVCVELRTSNMIWWGKLVANVQ